MSLWTLAQHALPHHAISRLVGAVAANQWTPFVSRLNRWFARAYDVDLSDALKTSPTDYASFNAMFTRHLQPNARPLAGDEHTLACPVDGTLSEFGRIEGERLIQAKGRHFTLAALLGHREDAARFVNGTFATIYLAPYNYHRIHMPSAGHIKKMTLVPGRLFSVNGATAAAVDNLFARNERVVSIIDSDAGAYALVAVGALNVGSIETDWHGVVTPPAGSTVRDWHYDDVARERGGPWGHFNLGSTVVLVWPEDGVVLDDDLQVGQTLRLGQSLGRWQAPQPVT